MAKVQLKQNLIAGGTFYRYDTIVDEEIIPPRLRNPDLIKPPGPPEEAGEELVEVDDEGIMDEGDGPPPPPRKR